MITILYFILCASIIFFAGKKLSIYGDLLAEKTGLGKAFIGLVLMSFVTSLPELMVGISSVTFVQSADLALGDILGSCALNLAILSLMDVFTPKSNPLFAKVSKSHILAAALGTILITLVGMSISMKFNIEITPSLGLMSLVFAVIYFISLKLIYSFNKTQIEQENEDTQAREDSLSKIILWYSFYALIIIVTALFLPKIADNLAEEFNLGKSFVGTLFLALSTSLPEIAVSLAAIKIGAIDMAIGNLFGSNLFNIFILFIDDIFYRKGNLLANVNPSNLISVFAVLIMTAIATVGIIYGNKHKRFLMAWDTLLILSVYILNIVFLYKNT